MHNPVRQTSSKFRAPPRCDLLGPPQHIFWASGGVAQFHLNQFCRSIAQTGISLRDLNEFARTIRFPRGIGKFPKRFFRDRIVNKPTNHCRAFAAEVLQAIHVLGAFSDMVLKPSGKLKDKAVAFDKLRNIADLFKLGDFAVPRADLLESLLEEHHVAFMFCYPRCAKPKLHYARHIPRKWRRYRKNLSCFSSERRHRFSKRIAAFSYNKLSKTLIAHDVNEFFHNLRSPTTFEATTLRGTTNAVPELASIFAPIERCFECVSAMSLSTSRGTFHKGDVLLWLWNATWHVGTSQLFLKVKLLGRTVYFAYVAKLTHISGPLYSQRSPIPTLVNSESIRSACPFQLEGDTVRVFLHTVL